MTTVLHFITRYFPCSKFCSIHDIHPLLQSDDFTAYVFFIKGVTSSVLQAWACEYHVTAKGKIHSPLTNPSISHQILELELFLQPIYTEKTSFRNKYGATPYSSMTEWAPSCRAHKHIIIFILKLQRFKSLFNGQAEQNAHCSQTLS